MCSIINYGFTIGGNLVSGPSCIAYTNDTIGAQTQVNWMDGDPPAGSSVVAYVFLYKDGVFINSFSSPPYIVSSFTGILNIPITGVTWEAGPTYTLDWTQLNYQSDPLNFICISGPLTRCTTLTLTQPPTTGSILCTTTPSGASVALDGVDKGVVTTTTLSNVPEGSHNVTFTLSGYDTCQVQVNVIAGTTVDASCTLVSTQVLNSISPPTADLQINTTQQFTAKDQNNNNITTGVTWAKTVGVGSINSAGLYSAGSVAGSATISATYGGVTKTASITVTEPQILTSISPTTPTIQINTTQQFTAKDQNNNPITTGVTWAKTVGVGSIDGSTGLYSAGPTTGTATISATYSGVIKTAFITVTTTPPTPVLTTISPSKATLQINTTQQFTAKDQNDNTIATGVTWAKTAGIGSINSAGLYSAGSVAGSATISATYGGVTKTASITITTTQPPYAGGGSVMIIAAVAAIGIAYFMMRKPPAVK